MISLGNFCKSKFSGNTTLIELSVGIRSSLRFYYQMLNDLFNAGTRWSNPCVRGTASSKKHKPGNDFTESYQMGPDTHTFHLGYNIRIPIWIGTFSIAPAFTASAVRLMIIFCSRIIHFCSQLANFIHLITSNLFMSSVILNITIIYSVLVKKQKIKGESLAA